MDTETVEKKFLGLQVSTSMKQVERATQLQIWTILKEKERHLKRVESRGQKAKPKTR